MTILRDQYMDRVVYWGLRFLPRKFDYGFTTALMYKDVRLCLEESQALGVSMPVATAVRDIWKRTNDDFGGDKDFTNVIRVIEQSMGVEVKAKT